MLSRRCDLLGRRERQQARRLLADFLFAQFSPLDLATDIDCNQGRDCDDQQQKETGTDGHKLLNKVLFPP